MSVVAGILWKSGMAGCLGVGGLRDPCMEGGWLGPGAAMPVPSLFAKVPAGHPKKL
jgi:hypothetical protein